MNDTEKLLRAFIEASGFDVEEVFVCHIACKCRHNSGVMGGDRDCDICCGTGHADTEFDYKVTKKPDCPNEGMEKKYMDYADAACKFESDSSVPMYILTREEFFKRNSK